jgi:16S rRNA (guanine527-N7)-methyltransferase
LIGKTTESDIWSRHILDAAQLLPLIPKGTKVLTDFGSGAGIPAIILSILAAPEHIEHIHVVEAVGKKTNFMKEAVRTLNLSMTVHNDRIEKITPWPCDVITARAFAPLPSLLNYVQPFIHQKGVKCTKRLRTLMQAGNLITSFTIAS